MDVKFGKIKHSNIFTATSTSSPSLSVDESSDENIFAKFSQKAPDKTFSTTNRMNDYDSNILENNAYQDMPDEMLKIEHKIGLLENSLAKINSEISALESFGETVQIGDIKLRKDAIEKELAELNKKYSDLGIGARISGQIASVVKFTSNKKTNTFSKAKDFLTKKVLAKISKKFNSSQNMKEALEKLSNINSNVDELITMQVPYGETVDRYEKLTAYLNKANVIHSQISKNLKDVNKK